MNNYKSTFFALFALLILGVACNSSEKLETEDGFEYILIESNNGPALEEGDYVTYSMKMLDKNDSVFLDSEEVGEMPIQIDDSLLTKRGPLFSVLKSINQGDSIKTVLTAAQVITQGFRQPLPDTMDTEDRITVYAKAIQKYDSAGFMDYQQARRQEQMEKMKAEAEKQKGIDDDLIQKFLAENNIEAQKTESGLYYVITKEGSGEKPNAGDTVRVNYVGKLLDETVFDSSYEDIAKENDIYNEKRNYGPIEIPIGKGRVIRGWDEGIMLLNEGAKATLFVPSGMAYGPRRAGAKIPANSTLIFDVELVEVK